MQSFFLQSVVKPAGNGCDTFDRKDGRIISENVCSSSANVDTPLLRRINPFHLVQLDKPCMAKISSIYYLPGGLKVA